MMILTKLKRASNCLTTTTQKLQKQFWLDAAVKKTLLLSTTASQDFRLEVKDTTKVNEKAIKAAGVAGVIRPGKTSVQVIIGTQVQFVADEFKKLCK